MWHILLLTPDVSATTSTAILLHGGGAQFCRMTLNYQRCIYPANTMRSPNVVSMLGRRRRHRANIKTTLGQRIVFAG